MVSPLLKISAEDSPSFSLFSSVEHKHRKGTIPGYFAVLSTHTFKIMVADPDQNDPNLEKSHCRKFQNCEEKNT